MARAATTTDAFNALAEPRRRDILDLLRHGDRSVNEMVGALALAQPVVSKHLRVLREVDAVRVTDSGRQRLYRLNPAALRPMADWLDGYRRLWDDRFGALDEILSEMDGTEEGDGDNHE